MSANIVQRFRSWTRKQYFIVLAAFLVYVLADGTTFSFGLYVDQLIIEYSKNQVNTVFSTSTIAALTQSVPLLLSPLVCWWTTHYGASTASFIGCLVSASGYILPFALQFIKSFWLPAIGYGFFLSVGLAFCYVPAYLTLPNYFEEDRGLATGLAVSGSGVGQVLLAVIVKTYILQYGWRGASFITGGLFLFMIIAVLAFRTSPESKKASTKAETNDEDVDGSESNPFTKIDINDLDLGEEIESGVTDRRSRGMTLTQVLQASVPIHTAVRLPSKAARRFRRHSVNVRIRNENSISEQRSPSLNELKTIRRTRANTIAVPFQTLQTKDISFDKVLFSVNRKPMAPIAVPEEETDFDEKEFVEELKTNRNPKQTNEQPETKISKSRWFINGRFLLFCFSNFTLCLVVGVPYVIFPTYISETFTDQGYFASWVLSNVGIASAVGQIVLGYLHDRKIFTAWVMYTFAVVTSGVSLIVVAFFQSKTIVLACSFLYGLAISANYALQVLILIDTLTMEHMANAFGILQFCQGISTLIGIPFQGLLRDVTKTYQLCFITSGLIIIVSGVSMLLWPCFKSRDNGENNTANDDQ